MRSDLVDLEVRLQRITAKAIAVSDGTQEKYRGVLTDKWFWLPKAHVEINPEDASERQDVVITLPQWLAEEVGLV